MNVLAESIAVNVGPTNVACENITLEGDTVEAYHEYGTVEEVYIVPWPAQDWGIDFWHWLYHHDFE